MTAAVFEEREDPGRWPSALLAAAVHVLLVAVLVLGVRWQSRPPETVSVELWEAPRPVVEPPAPPPKLEPAPKPPPPEPKPEPKIEKPDIAEKAPPKPRPEPPKPKPRAEAPKPRPAPRDAEAQRHIREQLEREQEALAVERERDLIARQLAQEAAASDSKALAAWIDKVRAKIRGNMVLPPEVQGNPEAVFDLVQLPTGEVLSAKLRRSSGNAALDQAIERAILKSSPLPRPERREIAPRSFELKYRPHD